MGGQAFVDLEPVQGRPINVPRMTPATYQTVASQIQDKLKLLFARVVIPRDAPNKLDHGDIDFLVGGILSPADDAAAATNTDNPNDTSNNKPHDIWESVRTLLNAPIQVARGGSHSFGIPHPDIPSAYVQVDVELSPGDGTPDSSALFAWTNFMKSDADLVQILSICHRHLGLTCNDRGLHVRMAEIEPYDRKKSMIFLTRDPLEALKFLGLDTDTYQAGFKDEGELFEWVSRGRFFAPRWLVEDRQQRGEKHDDRVRVLKRHMYRRFITEFLPSLPLPPDPTTTWTRPTVLEECLTTFSAHPQHQSMLQQHRTKEAEDALWKRIKHDVLPAQGSSGLALAVKGLRRWVDFSPRDDGGGEPFIADAVVAEPPVWTERVPPENMDDVLAWVGWNWQEVKAREKKRSKGARERATGVGGGL